MYIVVSKVGRRTYCVKIHTKITNFICKCTRRQNLCEFVRIYLLVHLNIKFVSFIWNFLDCFCFSTFGTTYIFGWTMTLLYNFENLYVWFFWKCFHNCNEKMVCINISQFAPNIFPLVTTNHGNMYIGGRRHLVWTLERAVCHGIGDECT